MMLGNLFNLGESRAISFQSIWGAGDTFAFETQSGAPIDENSSMTIGAFYACVLLISDTISTLPVDNCCGLFFRLFRSSSKYI